MLVSAEFWIPIRGSFVHIRCLTVRDASGIYRGALEVVQDIREVQQLNGERRLLEWDASLPAH